MTTTLRHSLEHGVDELAFDDVQFMQTKYTHDVSGRFSQSTSLVTLEISRSMIENGIALNGYSVTHFAEINESDILFIPERPSMQLMLLPSYKVAMTIADFYEGFGKGRLVREPRHVPQILENRLRHEGLTYEVGPEV
jgi:glutamine synthetase